MKKKTTRKKKVYPRITTIGVERLYNTGNYTNVKYSLTAEVPEGASAQETLTELVRVLVALRPLTEPSEIAQLELARQEPLGGRSDYVKEHFAEWLKIEEKWKGRLAARAQALKDLDKLGGTQRAKDAKNDWEDDDDCPW